MISHLSFLIQDEITVKKTLCASVKITTLVFGNIKRDSICIKSVEGTLTSIWFFFYFFYWLLYVSSIFCKTKYCGILMIKLKSLIKLRKWTDSRTESEETQICDKSHW